jgi:proline dehydrogenase
MPYLIRRAEENTSVAGQTSRETLIKAEREEENKSKLAICFRKYSI